VSFYGPYGTGGFWKATHGLRPGLIYAAPLELVLTGALRHNSRVSEQRSINKANVPQLPVVVGRP
jgi:hypothetical protein